MALRRFDEVGAFYESVVSNRRTHLETEIAAVKTQLAEQQGLAARLDGERSSILKSLEGRGALDDFLDLQRELAVGKGDREFALQVKENGPRRLGPRSLPNMLLQLPIKAHSKSLLLGKLRS